MYQEMICDIVKCNARDAEDIENIMRNDIFHSTLDWVSARDFRKAALEANEMLADFRAIEII